MDDNVVHVESRAGSGGHTVMRLMHYKGAAINFYPTSGKFKAEFPYFGGDPVEAMTWPGLRDLIDARTIETALDKPFEAFHIDQSGYREPERVKVIGTRTAQKAKGGVLILVDVGGATKQIDTLVRITPGLEAAIEALKAAQAEERAATERAAAARARIVELRGQLTFGPIDVPTLAAQS